MSTMPTRPAVRYFGGKWRLAPWIIQHFPTHRVYLEPYGGGASVLLQKPRSYAEIYNDLDEEMVNLFRVLRDPAAGAELARLIHLTPFARMEFEAAYFSTATDPVERARCTIIKSFMGYGSNSIQSATPEGRGFRARISTARPRTGFRSESRRSGTTPARDWANYADALPALLERMRSVVVECHDALESIGKYDRADTLHYVDPPYPHGTRQDAANDGYRYELSDDDHRALAAVLREAKGMVVLSGYPCALYDEELYPDWERIARTARADRARAATEVLWLNGAASRHLHPTLFD